MIQQYPKLWGNLFITLTCVTNGAGQSWSVSFHTNERPHHEEWLYLHEGEHGDAKTAWNARNWFEALDEFEDLDLITADVPAPEYSQLIDTWMMEEIAELRDAERYDPARVNSEWTDLLGVIMRSDQSSFDCLIQKALFLVHEQVPISLALPISTLHEAACPDEDSRKIYYSKARAYLLARFWRKLATIRSLPPRGVVDLNDDSAAPAQRFVNILQRCQTIVPSFTNIRRGAFDALERDS